MAGFRQGGAEGDGERMQVCECLVSSAGDQLRLGMSQSLMQAEEGERIRWMVDINEG